MSTILTWLCSLLSCLGCCGFWVLVLMLIIGYVLLTRKGKKASEITPQAAMKAAGAQVSQVFVRGKGGLSPLDDD
jgi:hypothetical protein